LQYATSSPITSAGDGAHGKPAEAGNADATAVASIKATPRCSPALNARMLARADYFCGTGRATPEVRPFTTRGYSASAAFFTSSSVPRL